MTPRKRKVIIALLGCNSVTVAAQESGVSERTIYRYLAESSFRRALQEAEREAIQQATRRLVGLQGLAIETLEEVLKDKAEKPSVRLKAATSTLNYLLKLRELKSTEETSQGDLTPEEWKAEREERLRQGEERLRQAEQTLADFEDFENI